MCTDIRKPFLAAHIDGNASRPSETPLPGAHTDRYSIGKPPLPRDRGALRIARPGPLASAPHNAQRDIIAAGKNLYAPLPQRILAGALEGESDHLLAALPPREPLKRKAIGANTRERKKAYDVGPDGDLPNCETLEALRPPPRLLVRSPGEPFLLYDIGSSPGMVVIFANPGCVRVLQTAHIWSSDGTFKASPASGCKFTRYTR